MNYLQRPTECGINTKQKLFYSKNKVFQKVRSWCNKNQIVSFISYQFFFNFNDETFTFCQLDDGRCDLR
jgi:hypothetical protein